MSSDLPALRAQAKAALVAYDLPAPQLRLLTRRNTALFRADAAGEKFVLRLYTSPERRDFVLSELEWLAAIRRDTDLVVPEPVLTRDGRLLGETSGDAYLFVLFRWVDGRFYKPASLRPAMLKQVGRLMAGLHNHAATFTPPPGFDRPRFDWTGFFSPTAAFFRAQYAHLVSADQQAIFAAAAMRVQQAMAEIDAQPGMYGLIHGDLQHTNYLFHKGAARAIDFGDCSFGYYLFDMAITLFDLSGRADEALLRAAFFDGYSAVRPLPTNYEALLKPFTAMRLARRMSFLLGNVDPKQQSLTSEWIALSAKWLGAWLAD